MFNSGFHIFRLLFSSHFRTLQVDFQEVQPGTKRGCFTAHTYMKGGFGLKPKDMAVYDSVIAMQRDNGNS